MPPNDRNEWAYEIKFDGYRILARIDGDRVQLFTRNGNDWSHKPPHMEKAIAAMGFQGGWLDGEVVVPHDVGVPDFQTLQNAFDSSRTPALAMLGNALFLEAQPTPHREKVKLTCGNNT